MDFPWEFLMAKKKLTAGFAIPRRGHVICLYSFIISHCQFPRDFGKMHNVQLKLVFPKYLYCVVNFPDDQSKMMFAIYSEKKNQFQNCYFPQMKVNYN